MIPFARIVKYGNNIKPKEPLQVYATSNAQFIFDAGNNNLYGMAQNGSHIGLTTGTIYKDYTLCASNVKRVLSNINGGANLILYEDLSGKIWGVGNQGSIYTGTGSPSTTVTNWTDFTSAFSNVNISDIKDVQLFYDVKTNVVMNNGDLWCMGQNDMTKTASFGNGTNVSSPGVLVKVLTGVTKASGNMYLTKTGEILATGNNSKYQFGYPSVSRSNLISVVSSGAKAVDVGYTCSYYIDASNNLYVTGTSLGASFGNEMGTGTTTVNTVWTLLAPNVQSIAVSVANIGLTYATTDGKLYSTGYNSNGVLGIDSSVSQITTPQICVPQITWNDKCMITRSNSNCIYSTSTGIFLSGLYWDSDGNPFPFTNKIMPFKAPTFTK